MVGWLIGLRVHGPFSFSCHTSSTVSASLALDAGVRIGIVCS